MQPVPSPTTQDGSVPVRFLPAALESIRSAADSGLKSLPRRGAEIGGILIRSGNDPAAPVNEVQLIASEYRYGPGYHLSPRDLALLRTATANVRERKGHQIVGFFRSCTSEQFDFSPNDLDVLREVLPDCRVLLIAKPFADGHSIARVFELRDGTWHRTSEFPISPARVGDRQPKVRTVPKVLVTLPPPPVSPAKKRLKIPMLWIYSLLGCLLLVGTIALLGPRPAESNPLGLNVNPEGDVLRVTWNRNSAAIRSGTGGVLRIDEGAQRRDITLDRGQLASGAVMYRSDARDITFHLAVNGKTHSEEMIRFVTGGGVSPVPATAPITTPSVTKAPLTTTPPTTTPLTTTTNKTPPITKTPLTKTPSPPPAEVSKTPARANPVPAATDVQPIRKAEQRTSSVAVRSAPQTQPAPPDRPAAEPTLASKPAVTPLKEEEASLKQEPPQITKAPEQAAPTPASTQPASPPPAAETKPWEPMKSVMHYFNDAAVTPPRPVREVRPKLKGGVPSQPMQIRVMVAIDDHGGVAGAQTVDPPANAGEELINEAINAARHWKFEPARDHGKKVSATYTITFHFPSDNP
jgi:hypothetical protein